MCECSIRVTVVLQSAAFHLSGVCVTISYFHCDSVMNTARPIITGCVIVIDG